MTTVMLMAGGTGGHIYPAAAVAEALKLGGYQVRWLGSRHGMENTIVPSLGYKFCALPVTAWHGGRLRKVLAPVNLLRALLTSLIIFRQEKPDLVVGFGGYASAPGAIAAWLLKTPIILHEQNGVPGLTNRNMASRATRVLQAFPQTFSADYEVVGNPVRAALCALAPPAQRQLGQHAKLRLLIVGGSQGALAINKLLPAALALAKTQAGIEIWHQTGQGKSAAVQSAYQALGLAATAVEFIDDMASAYGWCDLVVARSGASTVSELAVVGVPAILIPYPWHIDKQQYRNAEWLCAAQAAEWFEQHDFSADQLAARLDFWNVNRTALSARAEKAWQLGIRDSAKRIVKVVQDVLQGRAL
ncbi:undecaprenyldiphospho-muramoylpentapeptide beta-N-acetylglucosaminyltransferase [Reinekea sp.]|jgi:UDP-N-acetylglucosamine--N-acetylmuramyl-(pentapeptide) pyrophosphoryl-undecaprenol N-acetylglucosamine transferase|uniref:undecaprenyldiphospho-muramoylpentapeptide beta-N-acetylglucosaminyltransferase n=1 Tax=Reinekea sp. TaxID=1970455 RepID=UPI002A81BCF8|nr:undecaprenyldiphospho-muramoylpentapeptide beta-N-acetylglucosaminyltransferase [Reinekea sp.]